MILGVLLLQGQVNIPGAFYDETVNMDNDFLYACHFTDLWYDAVCPYVHPSVRPYVASSTILVGRITQERCGLGCSNFMCTLHMERMKPIYFQCQRSNFKVTEPL